MKRILLLAASAIIPFLLFAASFKSNALGQKLDAVDTFGDGYVLVEEENSQTLYLDSEVVFTFFSFIDESGRIFETKSWPSNGRTYEKVTENGRPIRETTTDESGINTVSYHYDGDSLSFVIKSDPLGTEKVERYLRDPVDGSLLAVRRFERTDIIGDKYLFAEETFFIQFFDNLVVSGDSFEVADDGSVRYEEDGVSYSYSSQGLLVQEEGDGYSLAYEYEGIDLKRSVRTSSSIEQISSYSNGRMISTEILDSGSLTSRTEYSADGSMVKTAYNNGKAIARIVYATDGRTILSMEYL